MDQEIMYAGMRNRLVLHLKEKGICSEAVLRAIGDVPRHLFVDPTLRHVSYEDRPLPIASGQTISQPYTVARQTELLDVARGQRVLEVGTGSGYQAAVLCRMGVALYSIERQRELFDTTRRLFSEMGMTANLFYGDGYAGLKAHAPFDRIIVTCGSETVPEKLLDQLGMGGRMLVPLGAPGSQRMVLFRKVSDGKVESEDFGPCSFVDMLKGKN